MELIRGHNRSSHPTLFPYFKPLHPMETCNGALSGEFLCNLVNKGIYVIRNAMKYPHQKNIVLNTV